jgi:taurine dehydrogenase small subunit
MDAATRKSRMVLLRDFGRAFNRVDVEAIGACVSAGFEWRLAAGPDAPDGLVVRGREAMAEVLAARAKEIEEVRFSETEVLFADQHVIGRFRATGRYADGRPLDVRGVDIYSFDADGLIAVKDSYWKRIEG